MVTAAGAGRGVASVGDLRIAYDSIGSGEPAVVLIHGAFEDRTYFAAVMAHLARRRRVISPDLRGHGESDVPQEVAVEDFEADVIGVVEHAGADGAVLCGHSMSGGVALSIGAERPDLVRGVVMLDGVVLFPGPVVQQARQHLLPALESDRWLEALQGFFGRTLDPHDPPEVGARVMSDLARVRPEIARSFFTSLYGPAFDDRRRRQTEALEHLACPLLYIHAKAPADLQRLQELRPDAMLGQVVGSGHYLMLSVPEQVNAMLDRFLDLLEPSP
jgi:pimeloyl-ACP methyl ester carboxylesterase